MIGHGISAFLGVLLEGVCLDMVFPLSGVC